MPDRPQDVVARGYDAGADQFAAWQRKITGSTRLGRLDELLGRLPERPDVLELGSGAGVRSTRVLAERTNLVGVDISAEQVRRARKRVPGARFVHADFTRLELEPSSFDAVVAFYVLNHVPREEYARLLGRAADWLRPGGLLLATFGASDLPGLVRRVAGRRGDVLQRLRAGGHPAARPGSRLGVRSARPRDDQGAGGRGDVSLGAR